MKRERSRNGEVRVLVGAGYSPDRIDLRDAGPIPRWAGVKVVPREGDRGDAHADEPQR